MKNTQKKIRKFEAFGVVIILLLTVFSVKISKENNPFNNENTCLLDNISLGIKEVFKSNNNNLILVNRENSVSSTYEPDDLVIPNISLRTAEDMCEYVRAEVASALESMFNDAQKDGIYLVGISGYRSFQYQQTVYDRNIETEGIETTSKYVAVPGTSEHQTGLVMDILSNDYSSLDEGFENTEAFKWLSENMSNYGFILRYPKGKEAVTGYSYEPWHLRYVGVDAAKEINGNGLTLEEYLN